MHSDNASHFKNVVVAKYLAGQGVASQFGIPHHPESQARVERQMGPIQKLLRAGAYQQSSWATHLPYIFYHINCLHSKSIGTSPYHAFFGTAPPTALRRALDMPATSADNEHERQTLAAELSRLIERAEASTFAERSRTHGRQHKFTALSTGDYVALWIGHQRDSKLSPYRDIRRVLARVSDSAYIIQRWNANPNGTNANQETITCHIDRMERLSIPPRDFTAIQAKIFAVRADKSGLGVVSRISEHRKPRGRPKEIQLRVHWAGIDDADEIEHNIDVWISPKHISRCKLAIDYLAAIKPEEASAPTTIYSSNLPAQQPIIESIAAPTARPPTIPPARPETAISTVEETATAPRRSTRSPKPKKR